MAIPLLSACVAAFCHEVDETTHHANFAADSKPDKAIARTMIAMTEEINSKYLSQGERSGRHAGHQDGNLRYLPSRE